MRMVANRLALLLLDERQDVLEADVPLLLRLGGRSLVEREVHDVAREWDLVQFKESVESLPWWSPRRRLRIGA